MASDFHTHHHPGPNVAALLSTAEYPPDRDVRISLQRHPWQLPEHFAPQPDIAAALARFDALGEIGLDRRRGPELPVQQQFLNAFLQAAQELHKPVVLHVVRCFPELFAALRGFDLKVMLHGFRGTPELLDELWRRGMTVSMHRSVLTRPEIRQKLFRATGAFGFESDDDPDTDVRVLLEQSGIPAVERITDQYFADFIGDAS